MSGTQKKTQTAFSRNHPVLSAALNKLYARDNVIRRNAFVTSSN